VLHESVKAMIPIEQKAPSVDRTAAEWNDVAKSENMTNNFKSDL